MNGILKLTGASIALAIAAMLVAIWIRVPQTDVVMNQPAAAAAVIPEQSDETGAAIEPISEVAASGRDDVADSFLRQVAFSSGDTGKFGETNILSGSSSEFSENHQAFTGPPLSRDVVRQLIEEQFADAPADTVAVWSESLAGLSRTDVTEILRQKRLLGGDLSSGAMSSASALMAESFPEFPSPALSGEPSTVKGQVDSLRSILETNLRNAWVVGYRSLVPMTEAVKDGEAGNMPIAATIRRRSCGRLIDSTDPLHLAIEDDGQLMFVLQDHRLTRRGDFSRLTDGRLGLRTATAEIALRDSPVLPEDSAGIRIDRSGLISLLSDETQVHLGRIPLVNTEQEPQLSSEDGVFFEAAAGELQLSFVTDSSCLRSRSLELSNVDIEDTERRLRWQAAIPVETLSNP